MPSMRLAVTVAVLVAAVLGVTLSVPWLKTPVLIALADGLAVTGVIVLIRAGQVSFGHAMYACLAGYGVAFIGRAFHLDALLLIALGTAAAALAGALIGMFMVRYRGIFFGMLNLAFSMVLFSVLGKFGAVTGGTDGLRFDRPSLCRRPPGARGLRDRPAACWPSASRSSPAGRCSTTSARSTARRWRRSRPTRRGWNTSAFRPSACSGAATRCRPRCAASAAASSR